MKIKDKRSFFGFLSITILIGAAILVAATFAKNATKSASSCNPGYYIDDDFGTTCEICSAGYYCNGTSEIPCPVNTYSSSAGASSCTACPAGTTTNGQTGQRSASACVTAQATSCSAGKYLSGGTCHACSAGTYSAGGTATSCTPCEGNTISAAGAGSCTSCGVDEAANAWHTACVTHCSAGKYYNSSTDTCMSCPGAYTSAAGSTGIGSCYIYCAAGTRIANYRDGNCSPCGKGYYKAASTHYYNDPAESCTKCPDGYITATSTAGSASECILNPEPTSCPAGQGLSGGECQTCAAGKYSAEGSTSCLPCAGNKEYSAAGAASCSTCASGKVANQSHTGCVDEDTSVQCEPGRYIKAGSSTCSSVCTAGYYCPGGNFTPSSEYDRGISPCPGTYTTGGSGAMGIQECKTTCPAGYYHPAGGDRGCVKCQAGTYSSSSVQIAYKGASTCSTCATGYIAASEGATACTKCATGYTSNSDHTECVPTGGGGGTTKYTITYNVNGGTAWTSATCASPYTFTSSGATCTKQVSSGSEYGTLPTPTRTNYTFKEWNTKADGTGTKVTSSTTVSGNTTVYAIWVANTTKYTITYDVNGGSAWTSTTCASPYTFTSSGAKCTKEVASGASYGTSPTATRTDYTFKEWNTKADGTGTKVTSDTTVSGNATVYAIWVPNANVVRVIGITVTPKNNEIEVGDAIVLTATITPSDATVKTVTWTSSDPTIATVDENGVVTGIKPGTVTITATTTDGNKSDTATVRVVESIIDCPAGTYKVLGSSVCTPCTGNTYTSSPNQTTCTPCPEGQIANSNHTGCQPKPSDTVTCQPGTYLKANGTTSDDCEICPAGFYCPGGDFVPSDEDQGKNLCPVNHIDGSTGTIVQEFCKLKCTSGTYKVEPEASMCVACPTGKTSREHLVNFGQISPDGTCYADDIVSPKTGLVEVGGLLIGTLGLGAVAYVVLRKRKILNI